MFSPAIIRTMIKIKGKSMELEALEYFIDSLYHYTNLDLPDNFDPETEAVRVMDTLKEQIRNNL
jgi:hypothetical protein